MEHINIAVNDIIKNYQQEINKVYPMTNVHELKKIWESLGKDSVKGGEKKKKTAYQMFFTNKRREITEKNPKLKFGEISKFVTDTYNSIVGFFSNAFNFAADIVSGAWTSTKDFVQGIFDGIVGFFTGAFTWTKDAVTSTWDGLQNFAGNAYDKVTGFFSDGFS